MRRTTVFLEEKLLKQAQRRAAQQGVSFAHLVRDAVVAYLNQGATMKSALPKIAGRYASGTHDTAERVDELLWKDPHR